ncbi:MAG: exodeoxyribonuclease VII large subunit [Actinobacteria bacterium]|nr:exodeoxyribonuclease VII large subunit [Actinomycetota bacterium]
MSRIVDDMDDEFDDEFDDIEEVDESVDEATLSVTEFVKRVNRVLNREFGSGVWVQGEVVKWRVVGRNAYCQLVENQGGKSVGTLDLSFFNDNLSRVTSLLRQHRVAMQDGIKVRVFGRPNVWDAAGKFSLVVTSIDPRFTLGDMQATRDELVKKLKTAGLYDENRRRSFPDLPLRVGVITSIGTAAWHDILSRFEASGLPFQLKVANVRVQGDGAVPQIVDAIWALGARDDIDVIMMVRGGGSKTDLACFDAEEIAVAIAQSRLPVVTGLGHEIDVSIADEVAYRNHTTPTACAAALIDQAQGMIDRAEGAWQAIARQSRSLLEVAESKILERAAGIRTNAIGAIERSNTRLALTAQRIAARPIVVLGSAEQALATFEARTRLLDPVNTMARGWSITKAADGTTLRSITQANVGDALVTTVADGTLTSTVKEKDDPHG